MFSISSIQAKAAEVDAVKQQVTEMEKEREDLNNTIGKLKQVCEQKSIHPLSAGFLVALLERLLLSVMRKHVF